MAYDSTKPVTGGSLIAADIRENFRALKEDGIVLPKTGTGATDACAGNDARLSNTRTPTDGSVTAAKLASGAVTEAKLASGAVSQAKLKTSTGSVNISRSSEGTTSANLTLPGGEYGFYPQIKRSSDEVSAFIGSKITSTTYITNIYLTLYIEVYYGTSYAYAQQRYVTSSGEVFWIFILRDKVTKDVISMWQAPDHPCFGNGGKPLLVPHPFPDYDETKHEIIVINPSHEEVEAMKKLGERGEDEPDRDLLEVIMKEYEIDEDSKPAWPTKAVTVGLPKDYETKKMGEEVQPIKKAIPRPPYIKTKSLRRKA